jgi:hypothetical protein
VCGSLPEEFTVNYGREMPYPEAYYKLINVGEAAGAIYKFCPLCKTYFFCVDEPQEYGSGNNASEAITRFSPEQSRYLETMLSANEFYNPDRGEVEKILKLIPRHQVIFALYGLHHHAPKAFEQFIPAIVNELSKQDDVHWWNLVKDYFINNDRLRAEQVAGYFSATSMPSKLHVKRMLTYCAHVQEKGA